MPNNLLTPIVNDRTRSVNFFNGRLLTDFDAKPVATRQATDPERKGNRTIYQVNPYAQVRIGNGGPEMTMDTLNGDVRILRGAP